MSLDIDAVFSRIGGLGRFQLVLLSMMIYIDMGVDMFMTVMTSFTAKEPPWRCSAGNNSCNLTGSFQPGDENYEYRCSIPREDWEFLKDYTSIVTEWDLVCERSILGSVATSLVFPGWFVGLILFGTMADKYGRKPMVFMSSSLSSITGLISAFSPNFYFYAACRVLGGLGMGGSVLGIYVVAVEFADIKNRGTAGISIFLGWNIGTTVMPMIAYGIREWDTLTLVLSLFGLPLIPFWWYVLESPRWLMVEGRVDEAKKVLSRVARINGRQMPNEEIALTYEKPQDSKNGNSLDLFRTWTITKTSFIMFLAWFATSLLSFGSVFAAVDIGGNMYLNFGIIGAITIPQPFIAMALANRVGRKQTVTFGLLTAALGAVIYIAIPQGLQNAGANAGRVIAFIIIRFSTAMAWSGIYIFTAEAYPTMTRNVAMGWCSAMARIGAFTSPYAIYLIRFNQYLPMGLMGGFCLCASILAMLQPDTRNTPTLETVTEIDLDDRKHRKRVQPTPSTSKEEDPAQIPERSHKEKEERSKADQHFISTC